MQTWLGGSTHLTMPNFLEAGLSKSDILQFFKFSKCLLPALSWIFKIAKFYWLFGWRGSRRISTPNFVQIGQSLAKILRLFDLSRWRLPHLGLSNSQIGIGWRCLCGPYASLYQISSKSVVPLWRFCFAIFPIYKMAAAILDYWNRKILLAIVV